MKLPQLVLASASPRRRELLEQIGVRYRVMAVDVDETHQQNESAVAYVQRLAQSKARAGALGANHSLPALGADTAVVLDDIILGKPANKEDALSMLAALSGREHQVMTAVSLVLPGRELKRLSVSRVRFRSTTRDERNGYWESGECTDKAGAYAIQGMGALFISHLEGSYSGVMGLPLYETGELVKAVGIHPLKNGTY
jgi:septum formation protein